MQIKKSTKLEIVEIIVNYPLNIYIEDYLDIKYNLIEYIIKSKKQFFNKDILLNILNRIENEYHNTDIFKNNTFDLYYLI